jgi:hypothetical protein
VAEVNPRDFALLQEEVKCLRKKLASTVNSSGGYTNSLTSPGSSIYPDSYYENCECAEAEFIRPDPFDICAYQEEGLMANLGDFATDVANQRYNGIFVFDAIEGVFYKPPDSETYENRNIGLSDTTLEHGCIDVWWYRKTEPQPDNAILWRVGQSKILKSISAGRVHWTIMTPDAPADDSLSNIRFTQVIPDLFTQDKFIVVAETITAPWRTWVLNTLDDGQNWTWVEVTDYNGVSHRSPIWIAQGGNGGGLLWLTTWADDNLTLLKLNNDPTITISSEYTLNSATRWEVENYFEVMSPVGVVDTNAIWLYGRASNPQSLGLSHILKVENEGLDWSIEENSWGLDWCGSVKISLKDNNGDRNYYAARNPRTGIEGEPEEPEEETFPELSTWSAASPGGNMLDGPFATDGVNIYGPDYLRKMTCSTQTQSTLPGTGFSGADNMSVACFDGRIYVSQFNYSTATSRVYRLDVDELGWTQVYTRTGYPTKPGRLSVMSDTYMFLNQYDLTSSVTHDIQRTSDGTSWTSVSLSGFTAVGGQGQYLNAITHNTKNKHGGDYHVIYVSDASGGDDDDAWYNPPASNTMTERHGTTYPIFAHANYYWRSGLSGNLYYGTALASSTDSGQSYSIISQQVNLDWDVAYETSGGVSGAGYWNLDIRWFTDGEWSDAERVLEDYNNPGFAPYPRNIIRLDNGEVWVNIEYGTGNMWYVRDNDVA